MLRIMNGLSIVAIKTRMGMKRSIHSAATTVKRATGKYGFMSKRVHFDQVNRVLPVE